MRSSFADRIWRASGEMACLFVLVGGVRACPNVAPLMVAIELVVARSGGGHYNLTPAGVPATTVPTSSACRRNCCLAYRRISVAS